MRNASDESSSMAFWSKKGLSPSALNDLKGATRGELAVWLAIASLGSTASAWDSQHAAGKANLVRDFFEGLAGNVAQLDLAGVYREETVPGGLLPGTSKSVLAEKGVGPKRSIQRYRRAVRRGSAPRPRSSRTPSTELGAFFSSSRLSMPSRSRSRRLKRDALVRAFPRPEGEKITTIGVKPAWR